MRHFLAIFKHCEILTLLLKSGNTVAINWLVIKLAGHSELTTKTVFCCHFFSFKPFVFKFRVPLAKKGFFMVASMILLSTSVFPQTLNIPGNQKWHFKKNVEVELQKWAMQNIFSGHQVFAHNKMTCTFSVTQKSSIEHLVFPLNLMRQFWFLQP